MHANQHKAERIQELVDLLAQAERKSDILTNLLKEADAEFKQALQKVSTSESNFRAIFENAPEAIYILDLETHKILDCNSFTCEWLGYARRELLRMQVRDILEKGVRGIEENIQKAKRHGLVRIQERRFRKKNGSIVDAEITGTLVDYEGRKCFVALVRDVTERNKNEALARYKALFSNVSDPVFINHSQGAFLEVNQVACERFGYSRAELLKMTFKNITHPDQYRILETMGHKIRSGETVQFEIETVTRTGASIPFEFHSRLIEYRRKPAILSVARDVSLRKKMEERLVQTERLSAVGEMASGVAHNFNNLLQMIIGAGEVALQKLNTGKVKKSGEAIQNILDTSRYGVGIVKRLKDFTSLNIDTIRETRVFDLGELIAEAVHLTQPLWKDFSVSRKFRVNYIKATGCLVEGKPSEIYELLVNLIKNAIEAMPDGGGLTIAPQIQNGCIHLSITDTGCGISEENLQRIFEPFFTTKGLKSSGLGLASCYGIVKKHRGDMQVKSRPGKGTTFLITLPQAGRIEQISDHTPPANRDICPKKIKFLLIDDEVNILKMMEMFFEDSEVDLRTAATAAAGLHAVRQQDLDLILCDYGMDDMSGLEVAKLVKEFCREKQIPKIPFMLYTGLDKEIDIDALSESGVDRIVRKPIACQDLLGIIHSAVSGQRSTEQSDRGHQRVKMQ